jgi:hypothetical protein
MSNTLLSNYFDKPNDLPELQDIDWLLSSFAS